MYIGKYALFKCMQNKQRVQKNILENIMSVCSFLFVLKGA